MNQYKIHGFHLENNIFSNDEIIDVRNQLIDIGNILDRNQAFFDLDDLWNFHKNHNRDLASALYNGFKYLDKISTLTTSVSLKNALKNICNISKPALIDINCRIDSYGEEKYLFDWHQDYWFSVASKNAVVVWLPITDLSSEMGGLEIISNTETDGRIFLTRSRNGEYNSYADAVLLDEPIPTVETIKFQTIPIGAALFFSFKTLHRSLPVRSKSKSRFTLQLRFVDFEDPEFLENRFKPGTVTETKANYLDWKTK